MVVYKDTTNNEFLIDGQQIEEVKQFEYLGSTINNMNETTERRLAMARYV